MQFAACQGRFQHIGGVHRAFRLAGADQRVQFIDEQDDAVGPRRNLLQYRLQPLLELAAVFRARQHRAEIERKQFLVLEALRHVAIDNALRKPPTIAVLPTPGSPINTGLFLVRRDSTWIVRRISSSRPMTGSSLPSRAASVRSRVYFFSAS